MKIKLHIEQLILDGLPVARSQRSLLQRTVERELINLLATGSLSDDLRAGGAVATRRAGNIRIGKGIRTEALGKQIAGAVYGGIGNSKK